MLILADEVVSVELDNSGITLKDTTGSYVTPSNEGGYGSPNQALGGFTHVAVDLKKQGKSAVQVFTGLASDITALQTGKAITSSFCDGVYTAKLWMGFAVTSSNNFNISVPNIITYGTGTPLALAQGYTHVSVLADPYNLVEVAEISGSDIVMAGELDDTLASPQSTVLYWWVADVRFFSTNQTALKLAKKLAGVNCDCEDHLEYYCMLLRIDALYTLGDYAGAQTLIDYLKQRLCRQLP